MAIQSINTGNVVNTTTQTKSTNKATVETQKQPVNLAADEDTINITGKAQDIKRATDSIASAPAVDTTRVAALKAAIDAGEYTIDPDRVAKKIMQFETQLPNTS
jgi:negative regulator of flagellin synthesis FlgM